MKKLNWILITIFLVFCVCTKAGKADIQGDSQSQAPEFSLTDLSGNEISLSDYSGKVVFLNFWATWCPPCRKEIPGFVEVYNQYKNKGMVIIGVSLDRKSSSSIQKFADEYKINYPVVRATQKLVNNYKPGQYIPSTIIIDKEGKIRHKHIGYMNKKILENYFLKLIKEI